MIEKRLKTALRALLFLAVLFVLLSSASHVLRLKKSEAKMKRFFDEEQGFDVLFTGQSHMQVGVSPMELWGDYGITSFNLGQSGETIPFTYWILRLALCYNSPKLIVVETRRMDIERKRLGDYIYPVWDAFPLSMTKLLASLDLEGTVNRFMERLFPLMKYHSRWEELNEKDFCIDYYWIDNGTSHYEGSGLRVAFPGEYPVVTEDASLPPTDLALEYLEKTIQLCLEKEIPILLTELPFPATAEEQMYANGVKSIAEKYNVNYLNYHHRRDLLNLTTDLADETHVNDSGGRKITEDLAVFIKEHYDIPDHRSDPEYAVWSEQYLKYNDYKKDRLRHYSDNFAVLLMLLHDRHVNTRITIGRNSSRYTKERSLELIRNVCTSGQVLQLFDDAVDAKADYTVFIDNEGGAVTEEILTERDEHEEIFNHKYRVEVQAFDGVSGEEIVHTFF